MNEEYSLEAMRHTAAHVLAAASVQLNPDTKLGVGPDTEYGFFHDVDSAHRYSEEDLKALEKEMKKIQKMNLPITQKEISKDAARALFANDPYKLELIDDIPSDTVGISTMGDDFFVTLCKGGHVTSTKHIGFFSLTSVSGVYFKGDETKPQLQRVSGLLFATKEELNQHAQNIAEAKKRDHRKLGQELDLFTFSPLVGAGLPLFTPKGTIIRKALEDFLQSLQEPLGYERVCIPHIAKPELYKTSGHWDKFKDDLFHVTGKHEDEFVMKPMNCPHHTQIFASKKRSYRELPLRYCEVTAVYRDEQAGELMGLTRVRSITQDDAHIFCTADQIEEEISRVLTIISKFYSAFNFTLSARLSLRDPKQPEKYLGSDEIWERAEALLSEALAKYGYDNSNRAEGEAAFYGPKIDFIAKDSLGRSWQLATVQLDFNQPQRFELQYAAQDGTLQTPVMIHRAILGSFERFIAVLLEHYAGQLPMWLSPVQVAVLPIAEEAHEYAREVVSELKKSGTRVLLDDRNESIGKKIHAATSQKTPVLLIIGKKEADAQTVSVRSSVMEETVMPLAEAIKNITGLQTPKTT
jgi:threonyl-tRNA synthetase